MLIMIGTPGTVAQRFEMEIWKVGITERLIRKTLYHPDNSIQLQFEYWGECCNLVEYCCYFFSSENHQQKKCNIKIINKKHKGILECSWTVFWWCHIVEKLQNHIANILCVIYLGINTIKNFVMLFRNGSAIFTIDEKTKQYTDIRYFMKLIKSIGPWKCYVQFLAKKAMWLHQIFYELIKSATPWNCFVQFAHFFFEYHGHLKVSQVLIQNDKSSGKPITNKMEKKICEFIHEYNQKTIHQLFHMISVCHGVCQEILVWELSDTTP